MKVALCTNKEWLLSEEAFRIYAPCMYKPTYEDYNVKMEKYLINPSVQFFVYEDEGKKAGILILSKENQDAEIIGISVSDPLRKKGIGRYMISSVMNQENLECIKAQTDDDAIGFYRRCGFADEMVEIEYPDGKSVRYNCVLRKHNG